MFYKILILIIVGTLLSTAANLGLNYYNTKISPPNIEMLKKLENKYTPLFITVSKEYDHQLNQLAEEAKKDLQNLPANETKTDLISLYLGKLNELERNSDIRFNLIFEKYIKELRQNRLPLDQAWAEKHKYQDFKKEKKSFLLNKYKSKLDNLSSRKIINFRTDICHRPNVIRIL